MTWDEHTKHMWWVLEIVAHRSGMTCSGGVAQVQFQGVQTSPQFGKCEFEILMN